MPSKDPLALELDNAERRKRPTKIEEMFAERPEVLKSIENARKRKLSYRDIALAINKDPDCKVSPGGVKTFLDSRGVV